LTTSPSDSNLVEIKSSGVTGYWHEGEFIILYDPDIWYTWEDSEEHKIHLCLQKDSPTRKLLEEASSH